MRKNSSPRNHYQRWTANDIHRFKKLAKRRVPTAEIARTFKRSLQSIYQKASTEGIVLGGARK